MLYNYVNFKHFVVYACFHPLSSWIPQFKYSKTILKRYYMASFNKTLSFQKLLHIDSKCHWQLIQSSAPTAQTRLSMCCWQENNCVISYSEQEADRKCLLCSSPRNHTLLRVPLKLAHQVLLAITLYFYFLMLSHRIYIEYKPLLCGN